MEELELEPSGGREESPFSPHQLLRTSAFTASPDRSSMSVSFGNPADSSQATTISQSFSKESDLVDGRGDFSFDTSSAPTRSYNESIDNSILASPPRIQKTCSAAFSTPSRSTTGAFSTPSHSSVASSSSSSGDRDSPPRAHASPLEQILDAAWERSKMSPACQPEEEQEVGRDEEVFVGKCEDDKDDEDEDHESNDHVRVEELVKEAVKGQVFVEEVEKPTPIEDKVETPIEEDLQEEEPVEQVETPVEEEVEELAQAEEEMEETAPDENDDKPSPVEEGQVEKSSPQENEPRSFEEKSESVPSVKDHEPESESVLQHEEPEPVGHDEERNLDTEAGEQEAEVYEEKPEPYVLPEEPELTVKEDGPEPEAYEVELDVEQKEEAGTDDHKDQSELELVKESRQEKAKEEVIEKSKSPPRAPIEDSTPRVSNHERKSLPDEPASSVVSSPTQSTTRSSNADWSAQAVESMSDAIKRLRNFAAPYMKEQTPEPELPPVMEKIPKPVDTSLESLYHDDDKESEYQTEELDLNALVKEIRSPKETAEEKKEETERRIVSKVDSVDHQKIHAAFSQSTDSMGKPKPPQLKAVTPAPDLTKPVPLKMPRSAEEILQPDRDDLPPRGPEKPPKMPSDESPTTPKHLAQVSATRVRSMTPMARMRSPEKQDALMMDTAEQKKVEQKTEEEIRADKQRIWKEKRKLADKRREKERRKLEGGKSRKKEKSKVRRSKRRQRDDATEATSSAIQCQTGIQKLFDKLVDGRCGDISDTIVDVFDKDDKDEESDESTGGYVTESDDEESCQELMRVKNVAEPGSPLHQDYDESHYSESRLSESRLSESRLSESRLSESRLSDSHLTEPYSPNRRNTEESDGRTGSMARYNVSIHDSGRVAKDRGFIKAFIAGTTKYGIDLYWHKKQRRQAVNKASKVTAFLRLGSLGKDALFDAPRLEWIAKDGVPAGSVPLFDIRSLDKATALQLERYPLAMPGRSLFLRMIRGMDYVFEASDEDAAVRFIHGMRWVIARLSFNLIIGNFSVSCELLDFADKYDYKGEPKSFPENALEETRWTRAMNDVTNHLVDSSTVTMAM